MAEVLLCSLSPSFAFSVPLYHHLPICFWAEPHQTSCSLLLQSQKFTSPAQLYSFVTVPLTEALFVGSDCWSVKNTTKHLTCPLTPTHTPIYSNTRLCQWMQRHLIFRFLFSTLLESKWKISFFSLLFCLSGSRKERAIDFRWEWANEWWRRGVWDLFSHHWNPLQTDCHISSASINMSAVKVLTVMIAVILFYASSQKICIPFMLWVSFGYKQTSVPRLFSCVLQN